MSKKCKHGYEIGDVISTFGRNLKIIDKKYKEVPSRKNGKLYINHRWYYKYRCLECGNIDWMVAYALSDNQHCGCNACCIPPKKIIKGINDISTTVPWMIKYFVNPEEATKHSKFSTEKVDMMCPDCGRVHKNKMIGNLYSTRNLNCPCQDGWSYPNKFMYSLLEQIGVCFESEKCFAWSDSRVYDNYIQYNGLKIITEQHGGQHYYKPLNSNARSVDEERANDVYKYNLAMENEIDKYFVIDSSTSTLEHMKNSIIESRLLDIFDKTPDDINWSMCDEFALKNLTKTVCIYKANNPTTPLKEIASIFHIGYATVLKYVEKGSKYGWCDYNKFDDLRMMCKSYATITNAKPIHCLNDGKYYRSSKVFVEEYYKEFGKRLQDRNIRAVCEGKRNHVNNLKFKYITQEEFNNIKSKTPDIAIGEFFKLKQIA